ncbi:hypothetical protein [Mycolicibacterium sphagni]|uniref:hypothetical protein n=1 Tax=Mycolicibacterium sphagni TaxID=1786 RepID=UPI0021F37816|nr:hypothetical protein [Mycolicibacterium sphagni]MCV7174902.1 hypothetical protein [Mycolicibacterium sphagni]
MRLERVPDRRTPQCEHEQLDGCYRCCPACNYVKHRCGGCGEPMDHYSCSGGALGVCDACRKELFTDPEEYEDGP